MDTTQKASYWSITINNPTPADEENISEARQKGWKVTGQLERGEEGTPHYQLAVRTPQTRFSAIKKAFPRAHIEVAKNVKALEKYVQKEETREGALLEQDAMYPSLSQLWDLLLDELNLMDIRPAVGVTNNLTYVVMEQNDNGEQARDLLRSGPLLLFDLLVSRLIQKGYHIESMASNPQNRFAFRYYHNALMYRSQVKKDSLAYQHNHAIQENNDPESIQTAQIPTITESEADERRESDLHAQHPSARPFDNENEL